MSEGRVHADLVIDAKKNRLRIYKTTLHELGDPKYIQLLVDPDQRNLVIVPVKFIVACLSENYAK